MSHPNVRSNLQLQCKFSDRKSRARGLVLTCQSVPWPGAYGSVEQVFDAGPYRGKRVKFSARARTAVLGAGDGVQVWVRVMRSGSQLGFFGASDRSGTAGKWRDYSVEGDIATDGDKINVGMALIGAGKAWMTKPVFEIASKSVPEGERN